MIYVRVGVFSVVSVCKFIRENEKNMAKLKEKQYSNIVSNRICIIYIKKLSADFYILR